MSRSRSFLKSSTARAVSQSLACLALASLSACSGALLYKSSPPSTKEIGPVVIENSLGMKLVRVPAAAFIMGSAICTARL
jgi:hypothetical protein